jgi:hypothetical protein
VPVKPAFGEKGFYSWNIPKPRGKLAFFLFLGFLLAIAFMLFHLWPLWLKIGIWYFSFYTLIVLVSTTISLSIGRLHRVKTRLVARIVPFRY